MQTRPFIDTLRHVEGGMLLDSLSDIQQQIVEAVRFTNKNGEITIKLTYRPEGAGQLSIEADIKSKAPKMQRGKSIFFITKDANLERNDPRQTELDIRSVDDDRPETFKQVG